MDEEADEWDEAGEASGAGDDDEDVADKGKTRGRGGKGGRGRGGRGQKDLVKKKEKPKCFCLRCPNPKKGNKKWCIEHNSAADGMVYQAERATPPELDGLHEVLEDPGKAETALNDFIKENTGRYRKKLIEWGRWKKRYGVRITRTVRDNEMLMDFDDFEAWQLERKKAPDVILRMWNDHKNSNVEREGEGDTLAMWISRNKTRDRAREIYEDGAWEEESKAEKDPNGAARKEMQEFAARNASDGSSSFIRSAWGAGHQPPPPGGPDEEEDKAALASKAKRRKAVDVATDKPKLYAKLDKVYSPLVDNVRKAQVANEEALAAMDAVEVMDDKLHQSYAVTAAARGDLLSLFMAIDMSDPVLPSRMLTAKLASAKPAVLDGTAKVDLTVPAPEAPPLPSSVKLPAAVGPPPALGSAPAKGSPPAPPPALPAKGSAPAMLSPAKDVIAATPSPAKAPGGGARSHEASPDNASSATGSSKSLAKQLTKRLRVAIEASTTFTLGSDEVHKARSLEEMRVGIESIMSCTTEEELNTRQTEWTEASETLAKILTAVQKATTSLTSYVKTKAAAATNRITKQANEVLKKAQADAKDKAATAKKKIADLAKATPSLYLLDLAKLEADGVVLPMCRVNSPAKFSGEVPAVVEKFEAMEAFERAPQAMVSVGSFGSRYKKDERIKVDKRVQNPVADKDGKPEFDAMFSKLPIDRSELLDESALPSDVPNVSRHIWLFGLDPTFHGVSQTPNGLSQCKIIFAGEVTTLAFDLNSLVPALKIFKAKDSFAVDEVRAIIEEFTSEDLTHLKDNGCTAHWAVHKANEAMFIPCGFMVAEVVNAGVLIYGARKTLLPSKSVTSVARYETLLALHVAAKRNVENMGKMLSCMKGEG